MKKLLITLSLLFLLVGCSTNSNTLTIATSSGYPPYEMVNEQGELIGFDIDLGNALAEKLGKDVKWIDMNFDGVIASLASNKADLAIAGLSPDPQRAALFSNSYYQNDETPFYIVTSKESGISQISDIKDKTVGVQLGTIQESAVNTIKDEYNLSIDSRDAYNVMIQEVLLERIDFLVMEPQVAKEYLNQYPELMMFELNLDALDNLIGNAIALPQDSKDLDTINQAIEELKADGTLEALVNKWFN